MVLYLTYLELGFAATLFVGAVDLELSNLPFLLLQENTGELCATTVGAGLIPQLPFV
jgi:hypothetical protein